MATQSQVKQYLACWLQVGKRVVHSRDGTEFNSPQILTINGYSEEFEAWWHEFSQDASHWYLEGSDRPLDCLLTPQWDMVDCPLCVMPVPKLIAGVNDTACTCSDLALWPNLDLPTPHTPEDKHQRLDQLRDKLRFLEGDENVIPRCHEFRGLEEV